MNPNKKVLITFLSFALAMLVIACSCSSLIPIGSSNQEAMPGLAGTWKNPENANTYVIAWQNGQYVVVSCSWEGTSFDITSQSWTGSSLTWSYFDSFIGSTATLTTTSLSGDSLYVDWSYGEIPFGPVTLSRVR